MLTIWGRLNSINVQKAVWAANEAGQPFTHIIAGAAFGKNDTPEYRAMNPNGLIPLLQDDGLAIWESNAIVRYIAAKYASGTLWAEDPGIRSLADRWLDWQATELNPALGPAFMNLVRTAPEKRDMAVVEAAVIKTETRMAILDAHLAQHPYLAGDDFTMADIAVGASVHRWLNIPVQRKEAKNVRHWYAGLVARPAAKDVLTLPVT
jgi:glutathione S-transferase